MLDHRKEIEVSATTIASLIPHTLASFFFPTDISS